MISFNPYRVFSSAETIGDYDPFGGSPVSIPIGFSHQLRQGDLDGDEGQYADVSIPIGFSHQLRRGISVKRSEPIRRFQSLSGFLIS